MRTIIGHPHRVFPNIDEAEAMAKILNDTDDEGWTYRVVIDHTGTGKAMIEATDAEGYTVGLM